MLNASVFIDQIEFNNMLPAPIDPLGDPEIQPAMKKSFLLTSEGFHQRVVACQVSRQGRRVPKGSRSAEKP